MSKTLFLSTALALAWSVASSAADQTWSGKISDSMCGENHKAHAEHGKTNMTDRDCTLECVKKGGKYVFVSEGKVYNVENQDFDGLKKHAGHSVKLSGEKKDDTIKVSKIEMEKSVSKSSNQ